MEAKTGQRAHLRFILRDIVLTITILCIEVREKFAEEVQFRFWIGRDRLDC